MKGLYVFLSALLAIVAATPECSEHSVTQTCLKEANVVFDGEGALLPEEQLDLNKRCQTLSPFVTCMAGLTSRCQSSFPLDQLKYYQEQLVIENQLCTVGSDLRSRFMEHSECLLKHYKTSQKCGSIKDIDPENPSCLEYMSLVSCVSNDIGIHCGEEATKVNLEMTTPIFKYLMANCV